MKKQTEPRSETYPHQLSLLLADEHYEWLKQARSEYNIPFAEILRRMIDDKIKNGDVK